MRVLLAEHEPMWREFLCARLQVRGLQPVVAATGEIAWSMLQGKDAPRLLIINRSIPALNGNEICRRLRLRGDPFYTYVVLLIPGRYPLEELVALESGADDCLAKPFSYDELYARLATAQRVLDIDDRLSRLNTRWRTLLDTLPMGVAAVDNRGILKRMNTTFAKQVGYHSPQELIGVPLNQLLTKRVDATGLLDEIRWSEPFNDVEVLCRSGGKSRPVRLWGRPLPQNDEAVYEIIVQEYS
jgi:PAS domain S-box-containing protein